VTIVRPWSEADMLTLSEAANRMSGSRVDVEGWLRQLGLVVVLPWGERVVWGAVLRAIDPASRPAPPAAPAPRGRRLSTSATPVK
jgi:hypothetical protein